MTTASRHRLCVICLAPVPPGSAGVTCHRLCAIKLRQQRHATSPPSGDLLHASHHHLTYGLSCAAFDALLVRADRRCEICRAHPTPIGRRRPASGLLIDHDHETGIVRGLVCPRCNQRMRRIDAGEWQVTDADVRYLSLSTPGLQLTRTEQHP